MAQRLGCQPDPMLSALASYRIKKRRKPPGTVIGLLMNWDVGDKVDYYSDLILGAQLQAADLGYKLEKFSLAEPGLTHKRSQTFFMRAALRA